MTLKKVDEDVAQFLHDAGVVEYNQPLFTNIFIGLPRPAKNDSSGNALIPTKSAWVIIQPGPEPQRVFGHDHRIHEIPVQLLVRGEQNHYLDGRDFAEEIWNTLEGTTPTGYFHFLAQQSGPIPVGTDDNGNPMFSLNFACTYQEQL
jgi:hypothetical protein